MDPRSFNLLHLEDCLWLITAPTGLDIYDFSFEQHFACRHPIILNQPITAIARMGAAPNYAARYNELLELNIRLIHSPEQYDRCSYLPNWHPLLSDLSPKSRWFSEFPDTNTVESEFTWPIFMKGERQTSKHQAALSIIRSPEQFQEVSAIWKKDPILHWQRPVIREFIPLRPASPQSIASAGLPKSYEFRCFVWRGQCASIAPYWLAETYLPTPSESPKIKKLAEEAAKRLDIPFLVVDIAQTINHDWIIIEVNDAQDSGYAQNNPMLLWRKILDLESNNH